MSINFYTKNKKPYLFLLSFLLLLFFLPISSKAAIGFEEDTNAMIDTIDSISDINIGQDIMYYDFRAKKYQNGFVNFRDNTLSGIRIEVKEIESDKIRVFLIDYEN